MVVFWAERVFFRDAVFVALGRTLTEERTSKLGCFAVRWWHGSAAGCERLLLLFSVELLCLFRVRPQGIPELFSFHGQSVAELLLFNLSNHSSTIYRTASQRDGV